MIDRFLHGLDAKMEDPVDPLPLTVVMPGDVDPFDRHHRFGTQLDAELRLSGLGACTGGGTLYQNVDFDSDEESEDEIVSCIVELAVTEIDAARALVRLHLPELGAPPGTLVQYGDYEDRFDGADWHLGEPRSIEEI
jgi:hypothetical protein